MSIPESNPPAGWLRPSEMGVSARKLGHAFGRALLEPDPLDCQPAAFFAMLLLDLDEEDEVKQAIKDYLSAAQEAAAEHGDETNPDHAPGQISHDAIVHALLLVVEFERQSRGQEPGEQTFRIGGP